VGRHGEVKCRRVYGGSEYVGSSWGAYRFKIKVTVSWLADCRTAWSPWMEVIEPRMRTVDVEGREAGEKAGRWEGRMRGVARDMVKRVVHCRE